MNCQFPSHFWLKVCFRNLLNETSSFFFNMIVCICMFIKQAITPRISKKLQFYMLHGECNGLCSNINSPVHHTPVSGTLSPECYESSMWWCTCMPKLKVKSLVSSLNYNMCKKDDNHEQHTPQRWECIVYFDITQTMLMILRVEWGGGGGIDCAIVEKIIFITYLHT